jgi:hypothetical protein
MNGVDSEDAGRKVTRGEGQPRVTGREVAAAALQIRVLQGPFTPRDPRLSPKGRSVVSNFAYSGTRPISHRQDPPL